MLPGLQIPDFIHIVIGGIMLFTAEAVKRFSDATLLMQCIDIRRPREEAFVAFASRLLALMTRPCPRLLLLCNRENERTGNGRKRKERGEEQLDLRLGLVRSRGLQQAYLPSCI